MLGQKKINLKKIQTVMFVIFSCLELQTILAKIEKMFQNEGFLIIFKKNKK